MSATTRRRFLVGAAATGGALLAGGCGGDTAQRAAGSVVARDDAPARRTVDPEHPNVIYVTGDDLGTQLGPYGSTAVRTPRLDAFAAEALVFDRAWCQVALCGPSRTSILTGLRPETTGVWANDTPWREAAPDAVTLPRRFRDAGYRTYAAGKISDPRNGPLDDAWDLNVQEWALTSAAPAKEALAAAAEHDGPFFVAVGFGQPHCPWEGATPDPAGAALVGPRREADASWVSYCLPDSGRDGAGGRITMTDEEAMAAGAGYAAGVAALDRAFGEVLDTAGELGLLEGTIVIFWSGDHGISLGGGGGWGKRSNHAAATRIPLVVRMPDGTTGRVPGIVEAVDMYPTLVEQCGLAPPPQALDGLSFAPLLTDPGRPWKRAAFASFQDERSVKDERYDLLVDADGRVQLHDMVEDPFEVVDVAAARPAEVARLRALLDAGPQAALPV